MQSSKKICDDNEYIYILSFTIDSTLKEETFASGKIREIFGRNFRQLANFGFFARIIFREFML